MDKVAGVALTPDMCARRVESAKHGEALDVTQAVLAREQRSPRWARSRSAAHERGTPLAHISIVPRKTGPRGAGPRAVKDDAELLVSQATLPRDPEPAHRARRRRLGRGMRAWLAPDCEE